MSLNEHQHLEVRTRSPRVAARLRGVLEIGAELVDCRLESRTRASAEEVLLLARRNAVKYASRLGSALCRRVLAGGAGAPGGRRAADQPTPVVEVVRCLLIALQERLGVKQTVVGCGECCPAGCRSKWTNERCWVEGSSWPRNAEQSTADRAPHLAPLFVGNAPWQTRCEWT